MPASISQTCAPAISSFRAAAALLATAATLYAQEIPPLPPPGVDLPRVALLSTGGAISTKCDVRLDLTYCDRGGVRVRPEDWTDDLPELLLLARLTMEEIRESDGTAGGMFVDRWYTVARRLQELADDPAVDGIVVAHETSTLAETAYFMNLVVRTRKPIVYVGAQRPWTGISGDGPLNLYNAIRVAATPAAGGKGVLHAMNQNVHAVRDVIKSSTYRMDAFGSVDLGVIGVADPDTVTFFSEPTRRHTYRSEFHISSLPASLPPVEIVYTYTDAPGLMIDALVAAGVKGIVIDGAGAGGLGSAQAEAVRRAREKGVVIVATARTRGGRVQDTPEGRKAGIIPGDNLVPEKARTLLQLALTRTTVEREIKRIFDEY